MKEPTVWPWRRGPGLPGMSKKTQKAVRDWNYREANKHLLLRDAIRSAGGKKSKGANRSHTRGAALDKAKQEIAEYLARNPSTPEFK